MPSSSVRVPLALGALVLLSSCGLAKGEHPARDWAERACYSYQQAGIGDPSVNAGARLSSLDDAIQEATEAARQDPSYDGLVRALQAVRTAGPSAKLGADATLVPPAARDAILTACSPEGPSPHAS